MAECIFFNMSAERLHITEWTARGLESKESRESRLREQAIIWLDHPWRRTRLRETEGETLRIKKACHRIAVAASMPLHRPVLSMKAREFQANRELVLFAVSLNGYELQYASPELQADVEVVQVALQQCGGALAHASDAIRSDRTCVRIAVTQFGFALAFAKHELKTDREIVLSAVKQFGLALIFAGRRLRGDREVVLAAVESCGMALMHASRDMQADHEIVLAACAQCGRALKYADKQLRDNRDIIMMAVQTWSGAFRLASVRLQTDREIFVTTLRSPESLYISKRLRIENGDRQSFFFDVMPAVLPEMYHDAAPESSLNTFHTQALRIMDTMESIKGIGEISTPDLDMIRQCLDASFHKKATRNSMSDKEMLDPIYEASRTCIAVSNIMAPVLSIGNVTVHDNDTNDFKEDKEDKEDKDLQRVTVDAYTMTGDTYSEDFKADATLADLAMRFVKTHGRCQLVHLVHTSEHGISKTVSVFDCNRLIVDFFKLFECDERNTGSSPSSPSSSSLPSPSSLSSSASEGGRQST
jgi:hypothetical protein